MSDRRAARMVELRAEGNTLQQIGDRYGLTRERVRQILAGQGVTGTPWTGFNVTHYRRVFQGIASVARRIEQTCPPESEHFPHGTVRGYMRGCSCVRCRTANRERCYAYRGITVKRPRPELRVARGRSHAK